MSDFNQYEAADTLITMSNYANQNIDYIYNLISEERKKKENFEYQYKSVSESNLIMMLEIFQVKKEIEEIKNNNISLPFHGWAALSNTKRNAAMPSSICRTKMRAPIPGLWSFLSSKKRLFLKFSCAFRGLDWARVPPPK